MKIVEDLKLELAKVAPDWDWSCDEVANDAADLISPKTLQVRGKNRTTSAQTIPIHVSAYPNARAPQLANFICEVLMIDQAHRAQTAQALLTEH